MERGNMTEDEYRRLYPDYPDYAEYEQAVKRVRAFADEIARLHDEGKWWYRAGVALMALAILSWVGTVVFAVLGIWATGDTSGRMGGTAVVLFFVGLFLWFGANEVTP